MEVGEVDHLEAKEVRFAVLGGKRDFSFGSWEGERLSSQGGHRKTFFRRWGGILFGVTSLVASTLGFFVGYVKVYRTFLFNSSSRGTSSSSNPLGSLTRPNIFRQGS